MEKKLITPTEKTTMFNEWLKTQEMPDYEQQLERQRWWVNKVLEFDKMTAQEYDICVESWVDSNSNELGEK